MTGHTGLIDADESAAGLIARIEELSAENSGSFWHKQRRPPLVSALTPFSSLIAQLDRDGDAFQTELPAIGFRRTAYGGLTTALCYEAAYVHFQITAAALGPQVTFIGPAMGCLTLKTKMLRQGRNVSFIEVDLMAIRALRPAVCSHLAPQGRLNSPRP